MRDKLMVIVSPTGKILNIYDTKPEEVSFNYYQFITDLRCEAIKAWMDREREVIDGQDFCTRIQSE